MNEGCSATAPDAESPWNQGSFPPLGLLYLASGLKDIPEASVEIADTYAEGLTVDQSVERILSFCPDILGVTFTSNNVMETCQLVVAVKRARPSVKTVCGGIHATMFDGPAEVARNGRCARHRPDAGLLGHLCAELATEAVRRRHATTRPATGWRVPPRGGTSARAPDSKPVAGDADLHLATYTALNHWVGSAAIALAGFSPPIAAGRGRRGTACPG